MSVPRKCTRAAAAVVWGAEDGPGLAGATGVSSGDTAHPPTLALAPLNKDV